MIRVVALALCLIGCGVVDAQCRVVHHAQQVVQQIQFVPVLVPQFSVGYSPDNSQLLNEIQQLRQEIQALKNQGPQILPLKQEHDAIKILRKNCAACHGLKPKDNTLTLFKEYDQIADLTEGQCLAIMKEVYSGRMPKSGKSLADADVGQIMSWIDSLKFGGKK